MTILDDIIEETRREVARRIERAPLSTLESQLHPHREDRPFREALIRPGVSIIAEYKRRSPSAGDIRPDATVEQIVAAYQAGGAAALSILTDEPHFGGSLADLEAARATCGLPILRKDFIVDRYQLFESAVAGADAVLLIAAALEGEHLAELHAEALTLDLDVLVEVHDEDELAMVLDLADPDVIGVNNRDLRDFSVDIERTFQLLADVPAGKTVVSESGFHRREQIDELERVGVDAVLIGESVMRAPDPEAALRALLGHGAQAPSEDSI
ncbi:MAG TPA: indole-3-glycerol phosphate synthase TrpC [Baekduia sp.]|nr:indole-3-glycerol phosphate synthase TrpC [Baekduia sp.]